VKRLFALLLILLTFPAVPDAGTLMRIHVLHEKVRGIPQQVITVFFWPAPADRVLHLSAISPDIFRVSSVTLQGIESRRTHNFTWRLPPTVLREELTEPYTLTATTVDAEGHVTGQAAVKFFVLR
jgi:hypothetical protein